MTLKAIITDARTYIAGFVLLITLVIGIKGYGELPGEVKKVKEKVAKTDDSVQQLAVQISQYIAVQEVKEDAADKREELLLKLIEKQSNDTR